MELSRASDELLPDQPVVAHAAEEGRVFAAVTNGVVVGHGSAMAAGSTYADIGVHVDRRYRRRGIATAAASQACRAVQGQGLIPVWGAGSDNEASLRVAAALGFGEVARLVFLVRA